MLSRRNPCKMPRSRRCWERPCAGQRSYLPRRRLCGWRWEKRPTRCCYPVSASYQKSWESWVTASPILNYRVLCMLSCKKGEALAQSFDDRNADLNLENLAAYRVGCHGAFNRLAFSNFEVEFRLELANDRLAERSRLSLLDVCLRRFLHGNQHVPFDGRTVQIEVQKEAAIARVGRACVNISADIQIGKS